MATKFKSPISMNGRLPAKRKFFPKKHSHQVEPSDHGHKKFKQNGSFHAGNGKGKQVTCQNGNPNHDLLQERKALPIFPAREKIVAEVRKADTVIVVGETASGKTTQIPQFLYQAGLATHGCIACTQPRRVAAITVAER